MIIRSEHATIRELAKREKRVLGFSKRQHIIERDSKTGRTANSLAMALANLLYPKEFPRQLASSRDAKKMYSRRINLKPESQEGIETFYHAFNNEVTNLQRFHEHMANVERAADKRAETIEAESGLLPAINASNIGINKNGRMTFFEIVFIRPETTERFIDRMPEGLRKKQAIELLNAIKEYGEWLDTPYGKVIQCHY